MIQNWRTGEGYPDAQASFLLFGWEFLRRNRDYREWWPQAYQRFQGHREEQRNKFQADPYSAWDEFGDEIARHVDEPGPLPAGLQITVDRVIFWSVMRRAGENDLWGLEVLPDPDIPRPYPIPKVAEGTTDGFPKFMLEIDPFMPWKKVEAKAKAMHIEARAVYEVGPEQRNFPSHWRRYLRLLDAETEGANNAAIARHIYKNPPNDQSTRKKKHDDLEAAQRLVMSNWRILMYPATYPYFNPDPLEDVGNNIRR